MRREGELLKMVVIRERRGFKNMPSINPRFARTSSFLSLSMHLGTVAIRVDAIYSLQRGTGGWTDHKVVYGVVVSNSVPPLQLQCIPECRIQKKLGQSPNGVLGMSYKWRNVLFLELFLDKTVSAG